ncbi:biotin transporter BioY [Halomicroarcula limicola]|uniref:Biotin transporter BioY n=1 Tax=Haloarcula limicola TaxID=1429915 RepID=A0A8J7YAC6_9EURY|nr:biotin transporter BioY [Halomicroarcula limicola]MBV0924184.1 biotin transporter BioY [Halomicroarcula limicola]
MSQQHESVELVGDETVRHFTTAVLIAALTAALSYVSIPLPGALPPFSLQHFGMFFAGLLLGPLWGGLALSLYLLVGLAGVPVFSNGGAGLGYFLGPTGGFLLGFLVGAVVAGAIVHRRVEPRSLSSVSTAIQVAGLLAAVVAVYVVGVPWMAAVTGLSLGRAGATMAPYFAVDVVKAGVAVAIVRGGSLAGR